MGPVPASPDGPASEMAPPDPDPEPPLPPPDELPEPDPKLDPDEPELDPDPEPDPDAPASGEEDEPGLAPQAGRDAARTHPSAKTGAAGAAERSMDQTDMGAVQHAPGHPPGASSGAHRRGNLGSERSRCVASVTPGRDAVPTFVSGR
jgi:hypothetical protein